VSVVPPDEPFVAYPRGVGTKDEVVRLIALHRGYSGLNGPFGLNLALGFFGVLPLAIGNVTAWVALMAITAVATYFLTLEPNRQVYKGKGWDPKRAWIASLILALNSVFCCGTVGFMAMQHIAYMGMAKLGVRRGMLGGIRTKEVNRRIAELSRGVSPIVSLDFSDPPKP
jgi:hypothetical protein